MLHKSRRIKLGKCKFIYKLFEGNSILQPDGNSNSKTVHHAAHSSAFFCHINENFSKRTITIFTRTQEDSLSVDLCFLRKPAALGRQGATLHNTCQFSFQLCIRRSLYSFLHFL